MAIKVTGITVIDDNRNADVQNLTATSVQLTGGTGDQGTITWNVDEETLTLVQDGVSLPVGQALEIHARNNTGSTITAGTVVMATGTIGGSGRITIAPFVADGNTDVKYMLGVTAEDISNDADGKVLSFGKIKNIDTSAYSEGDVLYVSTTTAGQFTNVEPVSPAISIPIAIVINNASNGTLFVRVHPEDENEVTRVVTSSAATKVDKINITGATVGSASEVPVITFNEQGQITSATTTSVAGVSSFSYDAPTELLTISTADGGSFTADVSALWTQDNTKISNWDTAYSWGNHANAGYLNNTNVSYNQSGNPEKGLFIKWDSAAQVYIDSELSITDSSDVVYGITAPAAGESLVYADVDGKMKWTNINLSNQIISQITDSAPSTLDTLNELAAALGDDPNFATTVSTQIGTKLDATANAVSASKLQTARTIALSGDVSGSVSFDGTSNVTITTAVADDSHNHVIANIDGLQAALDGKVDDSQVLTNVPAGAVFTDTVYTHPSYAGDDINLDTGALSGATVISDLDFNVTTDTQGHVTDANATYATRNITAADVGAAPASHSHSYLPLSGGTVTGEIKLQGTAPQLKFEDVDNDDYWIHVNSGKFYILPDRDSNGSWETPYPLEITADTNSFLIYGNNAFHDGYHPNADKWTTARTLSLTGAVTGSASIDGSGNVSLATTATSDPTLTLSGDASGSATFTNLGNATLNVTVANDSHTHDTRYPQIQATFRSGAQNFDSLKTSGFHSLYNANASGHTNAPFQYGAMITAGNTSDGGGMAMQLAHERTGAGTYIRGMNDTNDTWYSWQRIFMDNYHPNADKWTTARTLSLTGDVSGSVSWDGSGNVSMTTTVANDSHSHSNYEPLNGTIIHQTGDISSQDWNTYIDGTEASWATVLNHTGSNRPSSSYTYGTALNISKSGQAGVQLYIPETASNGGANGGIWYRSKWSTNYRPWARIWDSSYMGAGSGLDADLLDGQHASAFAAASHTHSYLPLSGGTITGNVTFTGADAESALTLSGTSPTLAFTDTGSEDDFYIHVNSNNFYVLRDSGGVGSYGAWDSPHPLQLEGDTNIGYLFGNRIFADNYHPNADKWTTARTNTVTLTGDVTGSGSATVDGSGNWTVSVPAAVADNSHNHTSLTGVTSISFAAQSSDAMSISRTINGTGTYFDFNLTDDNNNDWWRWRFTPSGSTVYDAMTLKPVSNGNADLTVSGSVFADSFDATSQVRIGSEVVLQESTDRADLLQITSSTSTWAGLQIRNSSNEGRWSFMTDGEVAGIYNDEDERWHLYFNELGETQIRHGADGVTKLKTTSTGVDVTGLTVNGSPLEAGAKQGLFWENDQTVTSNYTITAGKNAGTFGPVTINPGVTVTVPSGSIWSIV